MLPCNKVEVSKRHHSPCAMAAGIIPKASAKLPNSNDSTKMLMQVIRIARVTFGTVLNDPPNLVFGNATCAFATHSGHWTPNGALIMGQSALMQLDAWNWKDATVVDSVALHIKWPRADVMPNPWRPQKPEDIRKASQKAMSELEGYFKTAKAYADAVGNDVKLPVDSRWQAMIPVFKGELPVFVHANHERQIEQAMKFAQQYGFALTIVGGRDAWRIAPQLAAANVSVIYTSPYGIPERADEATSQSFQTPAQLAKAGVKFALSLDGYWDTRNVVFAAGQAISYGLSTEQALRSVTLDAAAIAGVADKIGSIEVGKAATLVVSDGDIFDYLGHKVRYMWIDGRAVDLNSRHKQLHDKYQQRYQAKSQ